MGCFFFFPQVFGPAGKTNKAGSCSPKEGKGYGGYPGCARWGKGGAGPQSGAICRQKPRRLFPLAPGQAFMLAPKYAALTPLPWGIASMCPSRLSCPLPKLCLLRPGPQPPHPLPAVPPPAPGLGDPSSILPGPQGGTERVPGVAQGLFWVGSLAGGGQCWQSPPAPIHPHTPPYMPIGPVGPHRSP